MLSKRPWLAIIPLIAVGLIYVWSQPVSGANNNKRPTEPSASYKDNTEKPPTIIVIQPESCPTCPKADNKQTDGSTTTVPEKSGNWIVKFLNDPVAVFTAVIAAFTFALFYGAKQDARHELRAYVALEDIYFLYKEEFRQDAENHKFTDILRFRARNFGQTPADKMSIWMARTPEPPPGEPPWRLEPSQMEFPRQHLGPTRRFGTRVKTDPQFRHTQHFFAYGKIQYCDIYGRWWVHWFCYEHRPRSRFTPYGENYNREDGPYRCEPKLS